MGGWISLLLAREMPSRICGLVTIAAAPDFTDRFWEALDEEERAQIERDGFLARRSSYDDDPYVFTHRLIEDGRNRRIFDQPLRLDIPVRFLHGTADADVGMEVALRLLDHVEGDDIRLTLAKGADHRFSDHDCMGLIVAAIDDVTSRARA